MLKLINEVTVEPVTLSDLKLALRVDTDDLDTELEAALSAARGEAEQFAGRSFAPQTWRRIRDDFWIAGLRLSRGPVDDIVSIMYLDPDGTWQTIPPSAYSMRDDVVIFDPTFDFPDILRAENTVHIDYDTGTWTPPLPDDIKRGITLLTQSKIDSLADQPETLRERAFSLLRPYRYDSGFRSA